MPNQKQISAVELLRDDSVLISFKDETAIHLTLDQLLYLGAPRITIAPDEDSFEHALHRAAEQKL